MASRSGIFSAAAVHLGRDPIADIDDPNDRNARVLKGAYEDVRDTLLRSYPWNFATRFAQLAGAALSAPFFELSYAADLPAGGAVPQCLRVWRLDKTGVKWRVVGRKIYTSCEPPVPIQYIALVDESEFDPIFSAVLALDLALACIGLVPAEGAKARISDLRRERKRLWRSATLTDAQEGSPERLDGEPGSWIGSRRPL